MVTFSRRHFLLLAAAAPLAAMRGIDPHGKINTVNGQISSRKLGKTLAHEHVLVDFIGADQTSDSRWDKLEVVNTMSPYFAEAKAYGVKTIVECTPAFLGRDARMLKMLSDKTGMYIITNTGYYGAGNNKYLPPWVFTETVEQLSQRWADDFDYGIDGSNIRPGFIKISVDADELHNGDASFGGSPPLKKGVPRSGGGFLSFIHKKLVCAAGLTHLKTGMAIYSHTGPAAAAFEQIEILRELKIHPSAFVWVHAQVEKDTSQYIRVAKLGAWVSLDGITSNFDNYAESIYLLKKEGLLKHVLISHDAGFYHPGEKNGGEIKGYTAVFKELIPRLMAKGFTKKEINKLLVDNPSEALALRVRNIRQ
jgi:phosphotriesterase-related protein